MTTKTSSHMSSKFTPFVPLLPIAPPPPKQKTPKKKTKNNQTKEETSSIICYLQINATQGQTDVKKDCNAMF